MDRFYKRALKCLEDQGLQELHDDIKDYVDHLKHKNNVIISELAVVDSGSAKMLLKELGYKVEEL